MRLKLFPIAIIGILLFSILLAAGHHAAAAPQPRQPRAGQAKWTFMVYLDGDNNLEPDGIGDFLEMSSVGSTADVNIVVQFDRVSGYSTAYGDWKDTRRFYVTQGMTPTAANGTSIGEANMGDPQTLISFVQWAKTNFPADHYALVLWDHGDGWRAREKPAASKAVAWDDTNGGDSLVAPELRSAYQTITSSGSSPLDVVGFDACLMSMIEVDAQISPYALVRVGSQETEPNDGWPYDALLGDLVANPAMTASQLGTVITDRYYASYGNDETQSAVDLGAPYTTLITAVDHFAVTMIDQAGPYTAAVSSARSSSQEFDFPEYIDLYHFASEINQRVSSPAIQAAAVDVMNAINGVVLREHHGSSWPGAHGISIYFPSASYGYDSTYDGSRAWLQFTANTHWDEWLHTYYNGPAISPALIAPADGTFTNNALPVFSWAAVPGAYRYRLQASKSSAFTSLIINNVRATTSYTRGTALLDGKYYWRVQVKNANGTYGPWSGVWALTIDTIKPTQPVVISPTGGTITANALPAFDWKDVSGAAKYQIQVDTLSTFAHPVISTEITTSDYTVSTPLANARYYWRARAYDLAGNIGPWTAKRILTIAAAAPVSAASGETVQTTTIPTVEPTAVPTVTPVPPTALPPANMAQTIESDDPAVSQAGTWTAYDTAYASGGRYLYSSGSPDDALMLTFTGSRVDVIYVKHPALGMFVIEIDGVPLQLVDSSASESEFGARVVVALSAGTHTLRVYPLNGTIAIDAFLVEPQTLPAIEPTSAPTVEPTLPPVATIEPTVEPTLPPVEPTAIPTDIPTEIPPTVVPTEIVPTEVPTEIPTIVPTDVPTEIPTEVSTEIVPTAEAPAQ